MDIVARWPGSSHDMTIFNNSRIRARIEAGEYPNTVLLGDAGYMLRPYFLTPIANPNTRGERLYNESHIRTRNVVERVFGVWKRRIPVLAYGLRCKLTTSLTIVVAAAILHNIAIDMKDDIPPPADNINIQQLNYLIEQGQIPLLPRLLPNNDRRGNGYNFRQDLINNYFGNL
ncbi:hypothetical protein RI129_002839 [Pyrocoelia pectoralis]|uniref:DDE Tnp4 domain-containing protein n=1 Tax=Pyrocoelia pectoralis TaxID=417401 RepID=A0AAN7ZMI9_9COLE